ncbi:MAG: hypothetical protein WC475_04145, partial [Candidatus Paceibacterota bacterium]
TPIADVLEDLEYVLLVPYDTGKLHAIPDGKYAAGAKNAYACENGDRFADIFLKEIVAREKRRWKPNLKNPFNCETVKGEESFRVYYLENIMLTCDSKNIFADEINKMMHKKYKEKIALNDIAAVFSKVYENYNQPKIAEK